MNKSLIILLLLLSQLSISQTNPFYLKYDWEEKPIYSIEEGETDEIIALKDKVVTEFFFEADGLVEYYLEHQVLWLNSDDNIEKYNKIYLPFSSSSELLVNKARVINKDGTIHELNESNIHTAEDEETKSYYKFFAFEGLEKGSFIEYYYVFKRSPAYKGKKLSLQSDYRKHDVGFELYAPLNLVFKFKSFNGLPDVKKDTLIKNKFHWSVNLKKISALENEDQSAYYASKKYVVYKLDENLANHTKDISSYGIISQNIYSYYYPEHSNKDQKLIDKLIANAIINKGKDETSKVRQLEFYIKNNFYVAEASNPEMSNLNEVLTNKIANETGIIKVYVSALKTLGIKHNIVLTSDRQYLKFDKEFEANCYLTDFLIYLPKSKLYLSPVEIDSRLGFPPAFLTDNYGLFIKEITLGEFTSGVGKVKYIKPIKADKTIDNTILDVSFDKDDFSITNVKMDKKVSGYYAMYYQPFMNLVSEEDKEELIENFAKSIDDNATINSKEMINGESELFGVKPLEIKIDYTSEAFVEKAGKKYLFNIGKLIGPQMQMYQEKERVLPLENEFMRSYLRTINVTIPEGYQIANLDDIVIDNSYSKNGEKILEFNSFYELNGNQLKITADEHYKINIIKKELYEEYRTVINSAADFNKITLVLEPK